MQIVKWHVVSLSSCKAFVLCVFSRLKSEGIGDISVIKKDLWSEKCVPQALLWKVAKC